MNVQSLSNLVKSAEKLWRKNKVQISRDSVNAFLKFMPGPGYVQLTRYSTRPSPASPIGADYLKGPVDGKPSEETFEVEDFSLYDSAVKLADLSTPYNPPPAPSPIAAPIDVREWGQEIGISSQIRVNDKILHMRMLDSGNYVSENQFLEACFRLFKNETFEVVRSGSNYTYHAYGSPLPWDDLVKWWSEAMIMNNQPNNPQNGAIDIFWLGHSLKKGHGVLRLSNNVKKHLPVKTFNVEDKRHNFPIKRTVSVPTITGPALPNGVDLIF